MAWIELNRKCLAFAVWIPQSRRHKVGLRHRRVVAQGEGGVEGWVTNRPPQVDDLEALGEKLRDVRFGKMTLHAVGSRFGRLVDVNEGHLNCEVLSVHVSARRDDGVTYRLTAVGQVWRLLGVPATDC
jgi:hypothetical protein